MVFNRLLAWKEIIKMGRLRSVMEEPQQYFRTNVIVKLEKEGWFEYLSQPRSLEEIADHFNYTEINYLRDIINTLLSDNTIQELSTGKYQVKQPLEYSEVRPKIFNESLMEMLNSYANFIPNRLRGEHLAFSGGINLFNWDEGLSLFMYEQMRRGAFAFTPEVFKKSGKIVDIGCGNGIETAAIWSYFFKRNVFKEGSNIDIIAVEYDKDLLRIAEEEFPQTLHRTIDKPVHEIMNYQDFFPRFIWGDVADLSSIENNVADYTFTSQMLHYSDTKKALSELYRVLRPGGIAFGTQACLPNANLYMDVHVKVIENAKGFFTKEDFTQFAKEVGFNKIEYTTPSLIYKFTK